MLPLLLPLLQQCLWSPTSTDASLVELAAGKAVASNAWVAPAAAEGVVAAATLAHGRAAFTVLGARQRQEHEGGEWETWGLGTKQRTS